MIDFFDKTGKMAIGSRLRMLTDRITEDATCIYKLYGIEIRPKWFPVFFVLMDGRARGITTIAKEIGHSHPSVSNIVKEMLVAKLLKDEKDKQDARKTLVLLSVKGKRTAEQLKVQFEDVSNAVEEISSQANHDLWEAIVDWEKLLHEKSLYSRVKEARRLRELKEVRIIDYTPQYQEAFRALNKTWITTYWEMEEADYKALDHPQEYILDKGGRIFIALYKDEPVGVCALLKMNDPQYDYELAKYAVDPKVQGLGIGTLLGQTVIDAARTMGAGKLYLESNTILQPALHIYRKLGFTEVCGHSTPYDRCNIQMELIL